MIHHNLLQSTQHGDLPYDRHLKGLPVRIKTRGRVQRHEAKKRCPLEICSASLLTASLVPSGRRNSDFLNNNNASAPFETSN
ncbi:hypothetical protein CEXT_416491 [Caerostris extrusa]|uniref:Uncharacterized protein n=1 Tax=Caerostris extrusa TaxID=172846 RepID=A0AAV4Y777_CAEEX|nr:hypothetical protein CEXT_416491 [Caerostris extrusa]